MFDQNPFPTEDTDRHAIWDLLVGRDSEFFLSGDWSLVENDYIDAGFLGIDASGHSEPSHWKIGFPTLADYRQAAIAGQLSQSDFAEDLTAAWLRCQSLTEIQIAGDVALAHKRLRGRIKRIDGTRLELGWTSIFFLRRSPHSWKITGFVGYLPL
ncbi:MAG: hypothetical protein P4M09_08325 [Devosia sp.]|nr:hypothetical protein [Devosia sp.]